MIQKAEIHIESEQTTDGVCDRIEQRCFGEFRRSERCFFLRFTQYDEEEKESTVNRLFFYPTGRVVFIREGGIESRMELLPGHCTPCTHQTRYGTFHFLVETDAVAFEEKEGKAEIFFSYSLRHDNRSLLHNRMKLKIKEV